MRLLIACVLLAANALLAALFTQKWIDVNAVQLRRTFWVEPKPVLPSPDSLESVEVHLGVQDLTALTVTNQKPLFFSSRRPPSPPPPPPPPPPVVQPPPPPPPDPLASIELYGLVSLGEGKGSVIAKVGGAMRQLKFGEKVGEWTLKGVAGRDVLFVAEGDRQRKLTMRYRSLVQAAPPPATVAASKSATASSSPPGASTQVDQMVQERRDRINKARIDAGLKPFETW